MRERELDNYEDTILRPQYLTFRCINISGFARRQIQIRVIPNIGPITRTTHYISKNAPILVIQTFRTHVGDGGACDHRNEGHILMNRNRNSLGPLLVANRGLTSNGMGLDNHPAARVPS